MNLKKLDFLSIKARRKLVSGALSFTLGFSIIAPNISAIPGDLGISTTTVKAFADEVTQQDIKKVVKISNDIFILKSDGTIYKNDLSESNKLDISNVKDIVFDDYYFEGSPSYAFFITNDGNVYAYGGNDKGQLGLGDTNDRNVPVKVNITDVKTVVTGIYKNTYFLKNDGTVFSCGSDLNLSSREPGLLYANIPEGVYYSSTPVQVNITDVKDIVSSGGNVFLLKSDGSVPEFPGCFSKSVSKIVSSNSNANNGNDNSVFFIMSDGTVYAYGENGSGQLGTGDKIDKKYPTLISLNNVKDIITDTYSYLHNGGFTYFLKNDGSIYTCGDSNGSTIPTELSGMSGIDQMIKINDPVHSDNFYFVKNDESLLYGNSSNSFSPVIKDEKGNQFNISEFMNIGSSMTGTAKGLFLNKNNILYCLNGYTPENVTSFIYNNTSYTIDKIYNMSDQSKYGSWFTGFYSKSLYDNNDLMQFILNNTSGGAALSNGGVIKDESQIKNKYFLSDGSMILVDNYGMVQYYKDLTTSSPTTLPIDGSGIIGADTLVFGTGTSAVKHPVLYFGSSSKYIDTDGSLKTFTLKKTDIKNMFAYKYAGGTSQYMLIEKSDGSLVYLNSTGSQQNFGINMNDVAYIMPATGVNKDIFVMKDGTLRDDKGVIAMPTSVTLSKIWSNRLFEMSDGFLYTLQNGSFKNTNTLATFAKLAQNNALLLKNGNFQLANTSGDLTNDLDVSGNDVSYMSQLDSTNMYLILNDGTTYGVGDKVQGDSLENHGIKIGDVSAFLSDGSDNVARALVTKDGTVYTNPGAWTKNTLVHFSSDAVDEAHSENPVYTNETDAINDYKNTGDSGIINKLPGGTDEKGEIANELNPTVSDTTAPIISVSGNPTDWTNSDATIAVTATDETGGSGVANITLPDGTVVNGSNTSFKATQNGTYTVKAADNAGNVATQTVTVSKIDKTAPTAPAISNNNETVTIVPGTDSESGVKEVDYSIDGGAYQKYTVPFTFAGGNHVVNAKTVDNAGNESSEVSLLPGGINDNVSPSLNITGNPTDWINKTVTLSVTASDETGGSGLASITMPDGSTVTTGSGTYQVTKNGTYIFKATDNAGNVMTKTVTVDKIDITAPTAPAISNNNGTVTIVPGTDSDSGVKETDYSIDGRAYQKYTAPFTLDAGTHSVKAETLDNAGNASIEVSENITVEDVALKNATSAVEKAESTVSQTDLDNAKSLVDALPDGQDKTSLENRIQNLQDRINQAAQSAQQAQAVKDATDAVNKAQQSQNQSDLTYAKSLVDKLPDGQDKTSLENEINSIKDSINKKKAEEQAAQDLAKATAAVQRAEITGKQADVDSAKKLVDALPDSQSKADLENRLQAVQDKIDLDNAAIKKVEDALSKANSTLAQDDITAAQEAINELPAGIDRVQYNNQLRIIQQKVQIATAVNINKANAAVTKVSRTKSITDLNTARNLINALPNCTQKTKLNAQLDIIQRFCK